MTQSISSELMNPVYVKSLGTTKLLALEIKPLVDILDSNLTIEDVPVILTLHKSNKKSKTKFIYLKEEDGVNIDSRRILVWLSTQDLLLLQSCGLTNNSEMLEDSHILKSWPLLYGIDTEIYSVLKYLQDEVPNIEKTTIQNYETMSLSSK